MMSRVLLLFFLSVMNSWVMGEEPCPRVQVLNHTGYGLVKLYVAPTSRPSWGRNLVGEGVLQDTESIQVSLTPLSKGERFFDILAVDADGDRYLQSGVDLSKHSTILLTFRDFLEPSKEGWGWEEYFEGYGNEITANTEQK